MKAVVTGGMGFIGCHLVAALLKEGVEVHAIDNLAGGKREERKHKGAAYHEADIREQESIAPVLRRADWVFHTAALPRVQYSIQHPRETHEANITGTLNVLLAARDEGVKKVIYSASSSAYGNQDTMPLVETMLPKPLSPYGMQKHTGELYCQVMSATYGLPTVSLRYFNVYGPLADPEGAYALVIAKFIKQRIEGKPLTITRSGKQTRDFTHVRDVVRANILAAKSTKVGKGEVINIGAGKNASVNRVAELIGGPVEYVPARQEPHDTLADNTLAKELLGWSPEVSLEEGIAELKQLAGFKD